MPDWAWPPPPPPPSQAARIDPPLIQQRADGVIVVFPMDYPPMWGAGYNVPSGWDDATQINDALLRAGPGGRVQLVPWVYQTFSQVVVPGATAAGAPGTCLAGHRASVIAGAWGGAASNTGAVVSAHGNQPGGSNIQGIGSIVECLTIDGTNVPPGTISSAIDFGDQYDFVMRDVHVQNFTSTGNTVSGLITGGSNPLGAVGFNQNNQVSLTEKCHMVRCTADNCLNQFQFATIGGTSTSRQYSDFDLHANCQPGQNMLVVARQGHIEKGKLSLRGNLNYTTAPFGAAIVLGINGSSGSQQGHIATMELHISVESDGSGAGPQTIQFGANADNQVLHCRGNVQFLDPGWQNANPAYGSWMFSGRVGGNDPTLQQAQAPAVNPTSGTVYTNNSVDATVYLANTSGISNVFINGTVVPGLGPFPVPMGNTIQINWTTTQPTWTWIGALAI